MNYGKGLTIIREALEMDTIDFADLCDMTPGQIFKIEENCEDFTMDEALKLCKQLKIPMDYLIGLSTELKDVHPAAEPVFLKLVPKLTECTLLVIRSEHLEKGEAENNWPKIKALMLEIKNDLESFGIR